MTLSLSRFLQATLPLDPLPGVHLRGFARWVGAPAPKQVSIADALNLAGEEAVYDHTNLSGASNLRAKSGLGFPPRPLLWKAG